MTCAMARLVAVAAVPLLLACSDRQLPTAAVRQSQATLGQADVQADGTPDGYVFLFHDCTGPAGTPDSFTAVKTELPAAAAPPFAQATAYHLTDGSGIFLALIREYVQDPPGIDASGVATTTCLVETLLGTRQFSGFLAATP